MFNYQIEIIYEEVTDGKQIQELLQKKLWEDKAVYRTSFSVLNKIGLCIMLIFECIGD